MQYFVQVKEWLGRFSLVQKPREPPCTRSTLSFQISHINANNKMRKFMKQHLSLPRQRRTETTFQYHPLEEGEIRFFRIVAEKSSSKDIHLEIQHFNHNDGPSYSAISYTWGCPSVEFPESWNSSEDVKSIYLNGHEFKVQQNLFSFLWQARKMNETGKDFVEMQQSVKWFWIDAICIDQENTLERNKQVLRMKGIYEIAKRVICWLGPATPSSDDAMDLIRDIAEIYHSHGQYIYNVWTSLNQEAFELVKRSTKSVQELESLFKRKWWTRAWIIQEVSARTNFAPIIYCGQRHVDWDELMLTNVCLEQASRLEGFPSYWSPVIYKLTNVRHSRSEKQKFFQALDLCTIARDFESRDPRDNVYSILSIALDGAHERLYPNYDLSVEQVYTNFATHLIEQYLSLDILRRCGESKSFSLPSWVPDWTVIAPQPFQAISNKGSRSIDVYNASKGRVAVPEFQENGQVLVAYGNLFDEVVDTIDIDPWPSTSELLHVQRLYTFAVGSNPRAEYVGGGTMIGALSRLISCDIDAKSRFREDIIRLGENHELQIRLVENDESKIAESFLDYSMWVISATRDRRLFKTSKGYIGLSLYAIPGDMVCILFGCTFPILLRPGDFWEVSGEAYVQGIMDGEAVMESDEDVMEFQIR
jgi:Heterokaryon incompatibility protein (HET)